MDRKIGGLRLLDGQRFNKVPNPRQVHFISIVTIWRRCRLNAETSAVNRKHQIYDERSGNRNSLHAYGTLSTADGIPSTWPTSQLLHCVHLISQML